MGDHPDLVRLASRTRSVTADRIARVLDPVGIVAATLVLVAVTVPAGPLVGLAWAALALVFCVGVPELALRGYLRVRGLTDRHLVVRESRHVPVAISAASVAIGVAVLWGAGAPRALVVFIVTVLAGVVSMGLITRWWKASFHTAVVASSAVVVATVLGPGSLVATLPLVALVAWARVRAGRHDLAQVLAGGAVGAGTALLFPLLR